MIEVRVSLSPEQLVLAAEALELSSERDMVLARADHLGSEDWRRRARERAADCLSLAARFRNLSEAL